MLRSRVLLLLLKHIIRNIHFTFLVVNSGFGFFFHFAADQGKKGLSLGGKIPLVSLLLAFRGKRSHCNDKNVLTRRKTAMLELN